MIFPTLRKELEKAIDLLEQDTPYRFRVVTPPPGYGSLRFSRHKGSWWVREQNKPEGLVGLVREKKAQKKLGFRICVYIVHMYTYLYKGTSQEFSSSC